MKFADKFRVYVDRKRRQYYTVFIFVDKPAMLIFYKEQRRLAHIGSSGAFEAITIGWRQFKGRRRTGNLGEVLFYRDYLGAGIVSHEMTHAMFFWARWNKRASEEKRCRVQGELVRQFWNQYYRLQGDIGNANT